MQRAARARRRTLARVRARLVGVLADAEPEVQAVGLVAERAEQVPERERVLAARHRDQHPLAGLDHLEVVDRPPHLLPAVVQEAVAAERGVVAADVDDRRARGSARHFTRRPPR